MISPSHYRSDRAELYRRSGWWRDATLDDLLSGVVGDAPDSVAVADPTAGELTWRQVDRLAGSAAAGMAARGVGRGDVVAFQLPNWWESIVLHIAIGRLGAISCPLHMIYRQAEMRTVLRASGAKLVFAPESFRRVEHAANAEAAAGALDDPPEVVAVRSAEDAIASLLEHDPLPAGHAGASPDDVLMLLYTSGTTGTPKGALHSHNTMGRAADDLIAHFSIDGSDRLFVPSPITHVTGLLYAVHVPIAVGASSVLMERWEPDAALDLVLEHGCTFTGGATPFVSGLIEAVRARSLGPDDVPLRRGSCGGADVPPSLVATAEEVLGSSFTRVYGMTEGITVTASPVEGPVDARARTDGRALPGFELRVLDAEGRDLPAGGEGEAVLRGPANFLGYLDPSQNAETVDDDGWIRSGDLVSVDAEGYLTVSGRIKDLIIRGGENLAAKEVEDLLIGHSAVAEVAIVGMPDAVMGERACAFVAPAADAELGLDDLVAFLRALEIAPQKFPERLELRPAGLPKTPSGKIRKVELREEARLLVASEAGA